MQHLVQFSFNQGRYQARIDGGPAFLVGKRVPYQGGRGLSNLEPAGTTGFDPAQFAQFGFWVDFIAPTVACESRGIFHCLNTYDRARFTFGFLQYAAHVPNGDFVTYFRKLLALPQAADYFADLQLVNGRIVRTTDNGTVQLETADSTQRLMNFLNPSLEQVEDVEVIQAAKFVHWVRNDPQHRETQVEVGVNLFRRKMVEYSTRYGLNGVGDTICLVVADIRHQGRATSDVIIAALQSADPLASLLKIGAIRYPERIKTLKREIARLTQAGVLGQRHYDAAQREFV